MDKGKKIMPPMIEYPRLNAKIDRKFGLQANMSYLGCFLSRAKTLALKRGIFHPLGVF